MNSVTKMKMKEERMEGIEDVKEEEEDDDENDPIVEEYDVYLTKPQSMELFFLQYPNRRRDLTYDDYTVCASRAKPKQRKIELELSMNVDSSCYDRSKGAQFVTNARANCKVGEEPYFRGKLMDKHTLTSKMSVSNPNFEYAAAVFRDGALHITPVHSVISMRPSFTFLNNTESNANREDTSEAVSDAEEEVAKPVTIKFAKRETEGAKQARERSFEFLKQKMEEEPWIQVIYSPFGSEESRHELSLLTCTKPEEKAVELQVSTDEYYQMILSERLGIDVEKPSSSTSDIMPLSQIFSLSFGDQIRSILKNAVVMKFEQIMKTLRASCDEMLVIRNLQQVAVMIEGCWVVKSDVIYSKDSFSPHTGVKSEVLIRARDYIMLRFMHGLKVTRQELFPVIKLHDDDMMDILRQMARLSSKEGWKFFMERDDAFIQKYPDVVQRQLAVWTGKFWQLQRTLKISNDLCLLYDSAKGESPTKKVRYSTDGNASTETTSDLDADFKKELRDFVSQTLKVDRCVTMNTLKMQLNSKLAQCPPGYILSRGISTKMYEEVLSEIGAEYINAGWPNIHQQEAIYVQPSMGDANDCYRRAIVEMFRSGPKHRKCNVKKKIDAITGGQMSEQALMNLLKEYSQYSKSGFYVLKGVVQHAVNSPKR